MIIVSACLAGINCRYDGRAECVERIEELVAVGKAIPVCPEQLGGLPTPRSAAEILGGSGEDVIDGKAKVMGVNHEDLTGRFIKGALEVLKLAGLVRAELVIFKSRSPSCGVGEIYDGTFSGNLCSGDGVTTALLKRNGFKVVSEEEYL